MNSSLNIKVVIHFRNSNSSQFAQENWHEILKRASAFSGASFMSVIYLKKITTDKLPVLYGNKLILNLAMPCIFWRPYWDALSEVLGDLVHDVAYARGLPTSSFTLSSEFSPMEIKMEMSSNVFKLDGMPALYSKNLKKVFC